MTLTRQPTSITDERWDVLIVGGGIVGAAIARDAAMRGLRTAVIDRRDFAFGTSSRSSRLLHGGLRYLAQGRLRMVREASREKRTLYAIAPHLAAPLAFTFPTRGGSYWAKWRLRIGVKLYDALCPGRNLGRSDVLNRDEALARLPGLSADALTGAVRYFDAMTNDSRLVIDHVRSAVAADACACNYVAFESASRDGGGWRCVLRDELTGEPLESRARCIVNATGPWSAGVPHSRTRLRLTKGVHLVVDRSRLPVPDAVVMPDGRRILFAIPWGERVILGTTDTDYAGPIDEPHCDGGDRAYVLGIVNHTFPATHLGDGDVIAAWAGLRPLLYSTAGGPSDLDRRHKITRNEPGWFDVSGGKLTTCRLIAEQTIDHVIAELGVTADRCRTADTPLLISDAIGPSSAITPPPVERAVVEHCCRHEAVVHLDDLMLRRTGWGTYHRNDDGSIRRIAHWAATELGWTTREIDAEVARYLRIIDGGSHA